MTMPLGLSTDQLEKRGAGKTAREISQQPAVWRETGATVAARRGEVDAFLRPLLARPDLRVVLTGAGWLSLYQVNVRMVETFRKGRILLAGDAAHVHSAAGGQGMNTGIQDAYNLGFKLDSILNGALSTLLDTYSEERVPVARRVLAMSTDKMAKAVAAAGGGEKELGSALEHRSGYSLPGQPDDLPRRQ